MVSVARKPNTSLQTITVLTELLRTPAGWRYGYDLVRATAIQAGTLYPILMRLESQGWLDTRWEQPSSQGRPARHLYKLNAVGLAESAAILNGPRKITSTRRLVPEMNP
jgi:PadR family transcriptional regulator PadR